MRFGRVMMLVAAISLYAPHCLMWAAAPEATGAQHCHEGQPANQNSTIMPCCENEGVSVPIFHPQTNDVYVTMAALPVDLTTAMHSADGESAFVSPASPPNTGRLLAELSVLRI